MALGCWYSTTTYRHQYVGQYSKNENIVELELRVSVFALSTAWEKQAGVFFSILQLPFPFLNPKNSEAKFFKFIIPFFFTFFLGQKLWIFPNENYSHSDYKNASVDSLPHSCTATAPFNSSSFMSDVRPKSAVLLVLRSQRCCLLWVKTL